MSETPLGPEVIHQPTAGDAAVDRPGFPPPGYDESLAAVARAEAAQQPGDIDAALVVYWLYYRTPGLVFQIPHYK